MLSRYVALGLLCIIFFSGCQTVVKESETVKPFISETTDKDPELSLDEQIEALIEEYINNPVKLIGLIEELIEGQELEYTELLARLDIACKEYKRAIERVKSNPEYLKNIRLLEIIVNAKRFLNIGFKEDLQSILNIDENNTFALNLYAKEYIKEMKLDEAQNLLVKSYNADGELKDTYIILGDLMLARVQEMGLENKSVLSSQEDREVTLYYEQALKYYNRGNDDTNALLYSKISQVYKNLGKKLEAIKALNRAIELNPEDLWNYYDRGKLYFYMLSYKRAEDDFLKTISIDPDHFFANVFLGRTYFIINNTEESFKYYTKALKLNENYYPAYRDYGVLLYTKGDIVNATNYLVKAYNKKDRSDSFIPLILVSFLIDQDNMNQARKILTNLAKYEKTGTMKDIYQYLLDPMHSDDVVLTNILNLEDSDLRGRLSYYVSLAMEMEGVYSLSRSILQSVVDSGTFVESKLAKYKLGELNE